MIKTKKEVTKEALPHIQRSGSGRLGGATTKKAAKNISNQVRSKWQKFDRRWPGEGPWPAGHMPPWPAGQGYKKAPWCSSLAGEFFAAFIVLLHKSFHQEHQKKTERFSSQESPPKKFPKIQHIF